MVEYPGEGVTIKAYRAAPHIAEPRPVILIVQEWWGLTDHIKDVAKRLAHEGYLAVAPDLYSRLGHPVTSDPTEAGRFMTSLRQDDGLKDLQATMAYLRRAPGADVSRTSIVGFSMGGIYALLLPCVSSELRAAVPYYGWVPNPDNVLQQLCCPVLYLYGEEDGMVLQADVQRLAGALKKYNKPGEIKTYPGAGHSFFRDTDENVYRPGAAKDAWSRTLAFCRQHLA